MHPKRVVLIVDGSLIDAAVTRKMILTHGFSENVITFKTAQKAIHYLKELAPDSPELPEFAFVSLELSVTDGFTFLTEFKKLHKKIRCACNVVIMEEASFSYSLPKINSDPCVMTTIHKPIIKMNLDYLESINTPYRTSIRRCE